MFNFGQVHFDLLVTEKASVGVPVSLIGGLSVSLVVCQSHWWFVSLTGGLSVSLVVCQSHWWSVSLTGGLSSLTGGLSVSLVVY